ncbi:hypothetical protein AAG906_010266 [Vitis piasezkii]
MSSLLPGLRDLKMAFGEFLFTETRWADEEHYDGCVRSTMLAERSSAIRCLVLTDKPLEEVSRRSGVCLGKSNLEGKPTLDPLRVLLADGMSLGALASLELRVVEEVDGSLSARETGGGHLDVEGGDSECWSSNCLAKLERELRKLECSVNFLGAGGDCDGSVSGESSLGVGRCLEYRVVNSRGAVGRVLVFWDNRVLQLVGMEGGKGRFLGELGAIKGLWSDHWCVVGNFNMIRFPRERNREGRLSSAMRRFFECPTPILLDEGGMRRGLTPFIFELMWLKEVQGLVEKRWFLGKSGLGGGRGAISTASFSILVNGTPIDFFQSSRSLRQEDPLPPYLFVVAMEALNCLSKRAISGGSQDQMTYLYWLLMCFEAILRLKINLDKSELIPVGGMDNIDDLALEWVVSLPLIWVFR